MPPVFTSFTTFVLIPIAAMAITIKNLLSCLRKPKISLAAPRTGPVQTEVITVVMMEAATKWSMNVGNTFFRLTGFPSPRISFFSFCILTKANISETGMIASVRVSFTMVAYSNTAPFVPCSVSQVEAAAVTEEVSLTAVPAKSPKPVSVSPSTFPSVGKISAAITLKRKGVSP